MLSRTKGPVQEDPNERRRLPNVERPFGARCTQPTALGEKEYCRNLWAGPALWGWPCPVGLALTWP